jgi:hypothetical protein
MLPEMLHFCVMVLPFLVAQLPLTTVREEPIITLHPIAGNSLQNAFVASIEAEYPTRRGNLKIDNLIATTDVGAGTVCFGWSGNLLSAELAVDFKKAFDTHCDETRGTASLQREI